MSATVPYRGELPAAAEGAVGIVRRLHDAGHQALLAGGCVRDLLLGRTPQDYDVATDAPPERVSALFRPTRLVGAQFGVVLIKRRGRWVEVATFRRDGPYVDGRHPVQVTLSDARHDALRRDFTVNGMFLDPLAMELIDYVGGRADLEARLIRAIGKPAERFAEDQLRLLRAVRFAARLGFPIEPVTREAIRSHAGALPRVAPERVRDELERMLAHASRATAWRLLRECGLLPHLWPRAEWSDAEVARVAVLLERLPPDTPFEATLSVLLAESGGTEIERIARDLTLSNQQREWTAWLVAHQADLDEPQQPALAALKRLMAHPAWSVLRTLAAARHADHPDSAQRAGVLARRVAEVPAEAIAPPPLVTGTDLLQRRVERGPIYSEILDALYTRQLNDELRDRDAALAALDELLKARGIGGST